MQELIARIEQLRHADAPPAPACLPLGMEANASCRRADEFLAYMQKHHIHPVAFRRPAHKADPTVAHRYNISPSKQLQDMLVRGWPIIVPDQEDPNAPGVRWAQLETGRTYRLPLVVANSRLEDEAEPPLLSENTVVHPYAHPDIRRFPGAEEWQQIAPPIHGLDVLALAAIRLVDLDSAVRV